MSYFVLGRDDKQHMKTKALSQVVSDLQPYVLDHTVSQCKLPSLPLRTTKSSDVNPGISHRNLQSVISHTAINHTVEPISIVLSMICCYLVVNVTEVKR